VESRAPLTHAAAVLLTFKQQGGTRAEALAVLEQLRSEATTEATGDAVLEIMDITTGFCSPGLRVWD
jgi:hypothetical protein